MTSPDELRGLIERLEKAEGPNFQLECDIFECIHEPDDLPLSATPNYTGSLDAARTLLLPGCGYTIEFSPVAGAKVTIAGVFVGRAGTVENAFCIAALRARLAQAEEEKV